MKGTKELLIAAAIALMLIAVIVLDIVPKAESQDLISSPSEDPSRTITVVGVGTINIVPDVAQVNVGAEARADTVSEAKAAVDGQMVAIQAALQGMGIDGKDIQAQLSGHAACVYAIVPPMLKRDCQVAIPCRGDRSIALAQDDEILFSLVPEMLPDFIEGMRWLDEHGWSIPMIQRYQAEYDLNLRYKELAEQLGMDMRQSPPRPQKFREY